MTNNEYKRLRKGMWIICKDEYKCGLTKSKAYQILLARQSIDGLIIIADDDDDTAYICEENVTSCFERNYKFLSKGYILKLLRGL